MDRIVHAVNPDTGEVLNPYQLIGSSPQGSRESLESITWRVIPIVKALKFFTLSTRGFAKREREHVIQFLQEVTDVSAYSKEEILENGFTSCGAATFTHITMATLGNTRRP